MRQDAMETAEQYKKAHQRKNRWYKVVTCLAAVVVFCTTYALILPAITMETKCDIPEHTHTESCYTQVTTVTKKVLVCNADEDHTHDEACYGTTEAPHTHTDECYSESGELICNLPTESDETMGQTLLCGGSETAPHQHTEACFETVEEPADTTTLTCTNTDPGHVHTAICYGTWELTCGMEEHTHSEECQGAEEADTKAGVPVLTAAGEDYTVSVMPGSEAGLPENTELIVTEIPEGSEEYNTYFLQAETALQNAGADDPLVFARFFDVQLISDGEPVEPEAPVSVSITYADMEGLESADCHAVHFTAEGVELLEAAAEKNENGDVSVSHIQSGFSVVGNVVTQAENSPISTYN